ncbi:YggS family pyridoxal phosphate-dependent enzyme [Clostridium arbusti]|uniref:YggS family pyridoxal phosphate-dependent enzyme n=1 Tax=Clostridium arbusti TaxID=1137848 RepID=UPI0002890EFA|nr:YggS family pyridoxal phosphate-dependent enzyme [Clostridium arbusti]
MSIVENICKIKTQLPKNATLIAVSKTRKVEEIREAYNEGMRDFGENKVQELVEKVDCFDSSVRWHLIGHLQTNKVKYIVGKVHLIHSLDSIKLLKEIEKRYGASNLVAKVLVQINIGKEESKTGIFKEQLNDILEACENCNNVKVKGLMAVIPKGSEEECKKYFREMKDIWEKTKRKEYKNISMDYLSMGMTHDYKIALNEGSNMVRIGEGIFGERDYNKA